MRALVAALVLCLCLADAAQADTRTRHARQELRAGVSSRSSYERPTRFDGGRNRSSYRPASRPPYPSSYRRRR